MKPGLAEVSLHAQAMSARRLALSRSLRAGLVLRARHTARRTVYEDLLGFGMICAFFDTDSEPMSGTLQRLQPLSLLAKSFEFVM